MQRRAPKGNTRLRHYHHRVFVGHVVRDGRCTHTPFWVVRCRCHVVVHTVDNALAADDHDVAAGAGDIVVNSALNMVVEDKGFLADTARSQLQAERSGCTPAERTDNSLCFSIIYLINVYVSFFRFVYIRPGTPACKLRSF